MSKLFAAALIMLIATPVFAAPSAKSNRQVYSELRASNPEGWQRCRQLARERGYKGGDLDVAPVRRFIRKCMQGTQR